MIRKTTLSAKKRPCCCGKTTISSSRQSRCFLLLLCGAGLMAVQVIFLYENKYVTFSSSPSSPSLPLPVPDISATDVTTTTTRISSNNVETQTNKETTSPPPPPPPPLSTNKKKNHKFPNVILPDPNPNKTYRWQNKNDVKNDPSWVWIERTIDNNNNITNKRKMVVPSPLLTKNHTYWPLDSIISSSSSSPATTTTKSKSIVFYGSSHIRELYFSLIRLKRGIAYNADLESVIRDVGFHPITRQLCCPNDGDIWGKVGIDFTHCGYLDKRLVPELEPASVGIGFKTFLHTPDSEQEFVNFLTHHGIRHPYTLVVDIGIWGPRNNRTWIKSNITNIPLLHWSKEVEYYFNWITTTFPTTHVVYVFEYAPYVVTPGMYMNILHQLLLMHHDDDDDDDDELQQNTTMTKNYYNNHHDDSSSTLSSSSPSSLLIRKDIIIKNIPSKMECKHGCAGPAMEIVARYFLGWLQDLVSFESSSSPK